MSDRFQTVFGDILQTEPQVVFTIPHPSNSNMSLITREEPETPEELRACRRRITAYYYKAAIRTYNIFKDFGVDQLQRTTKTTLRIIKELPEADYQALVD
ncbi:20582_t:CDS:2 [Gigaspora rosea]|nr:20582_t:CDS:2 [Gigaspora rosea]